MSSQAMLGIWIIFGFLLVIVGAVVTIIVLTYKLGVYKGKLARYELAEKQTSMTNAQP